LHGVSSLIGAYLLFAGIAMLALVALEMGNRPAESPVLASSVSSSTPIALNRRS
jgi:hypothetical protein